MTDITDVDLARAAEPDSTQINADDLIAGPRVVTIVDVRKGNSEQPVQIETAEFGPGKVYRPGKSMIRVLIAAWGTKVDDYKGRRLMLYRDGSITFGRDVVGGIRISAMSHLSEPLSLPLTVTRGKRTAYRVEPLAEPAPKPIPDDFADKLRAEDITVEALEKARTYLEGKRADFPDQAADLLALVDGRLAEIAGGAA